MEITNNVIIVVILIAIVLIALFLLSFFIPKKHMSLYGSARFGKSKHLHIWNRGIKINRKRLSRKMSFQHMIIAGPTGSKKTQYVLAKNSFLLPKKYSCIITDPKMELHKISSGYVQEKLKTKTYVLNLSHPEQSIGWNPFAGIKTEEIQGLVTDIYDIVNEKESEAIWKFGSIDLLTTIVKILHQYENGKYLNFANIMRLLNYLQLSPKRIQAWIHEHIDDKEILLAFDRYNDSEEKIRQGILAGSITAIVPYCSEAVMKISGCHTFPSIHAFRKEKSVLYLGLPIGEDKSYAPFLTLFLSKFFQEVMKTEYTKDQYPLACILEEFGNLRKIADYPQLVASIRDKRVMLMHCLQNLDQLEYVYGKQGAEIIANNNASWLLLPGIKSQRTLSYVTEGLLGASTHQEQLLESGQTRIIARPLMTKDEVRRLSSGTGLFICDNEQAEMLSLRPLYKSLRLKMKYGLHSAHGQLKSKYPPVQHSVIPKEIDYIDFAGSNSTNNDEIDFNKRLNKLFPESLFTL